jgi:hypothetical protein
MITKTTWHVIKDVVDDCNILKFAEKQMPGFQETWICYLYFQFTDPEKITPYQRIIIQKKVAKEYHYSTVVCLLLLKDGELVTGPGVRHLLGATGDGSKWIPPPDLSKHDEWERVFIQCTTADKNLKPETKLLFCE